jgi:rod shape determining protein RodA
MNGAREMLRRRRAAQDETREIRRGPSLYAPQRVLSLRSVRWFELDWHVLVIALILLALGMTFIHAMAQADEMHQRERDAINFGSHLKKVLICLPVLVAALAVRPRWLRRSAYAIYGGCIFLLLLVAVIGISKNGAKRWIPTGVEFDLQPSELVKIGLILALARVLYRNRLQRLGDWGPPLLIALVPMGLVAKQPDLGTALTMVPITLGMLYLAGARASVLLRFILGAALLGLALWQFQIGVKGYQMQRIDTWWNGFQAQDLIDSKNRAAFHSYQARVAIGHGGLLGTGLGDGVANQTGYLPERQCDSVFAVVAEESGWLGTVAILLLYVVMIALIMGSAGGIRDRFSRLAVGGIALYFAAHFFINISVNLGLIPMTGLTLPLFSTGGSSLLATFIALGLALGLASHHEPSLDKDSFTT